MSARNPVEPFDDADQRAQAWFADGERMAANAAAFDGDVSLCISRLIQLIDPLANSWPVWDMANRAIVLLGRIGPSAVAAVPALSRAMYADPRGMGVTAADALGDIGGNEATSELHRACLSTSDRKLFGACRNSLIRLENGAREWLTTVVNDTTRSDHERSVTLHILKDGGCPATRLASLSIGILMESPSDYLASAIVELLERYDVSTRVDVVLPMLRANARDAAEYREPSSVTSGVNVWLQRLRDKIERES